MFVSSVFGTIPAPGISVYSASKAFISYLAHGLSYELRMMSHKIDVLSYEAGRVSTKLIGQAEGGSVISTQKAVSSSLRDLGKEVRTSGALIHEVMYNVCHALPSEKFASMTYQHAVEDLKKARG